MYLFNNYEVWSMPQEGEKSLSGLKKAFPKFFDAENPQPVKIHALDKMFRNVKRVSDDENRRELRPVRKAPEPTGHKAVANLIIDGKQINLQLAGSMPEVGIASKKFAPFANRIELRHGMTIPTNDPEQLFFLYYGLGVFRNGHTPSRSPMYEFYSAEEKAEVRMTDWKKKQELEALVYTQLSSDQVIKALKGLGLDISTSESINRTKLVDKVRTGNDLFKQTFYDLIKEAGTPEFAKPIPDAVSELIEEEKIKDEGGKWYSMSKVKLGEWNKTPFFDSKNENSAESRLALIEHLKINDSLLSKLIS